MIEKIHVLLIEKDPEARDCLLETLSQVRNTPFRLETVTSLQDGIRCLHLDTIDIVLIDLHFLMEDAQILTHVQTHSPHTASVVLLESDDDLSTLNELVEDTSFYITKADRSPRLFEMTLRGAFAQKQCQEMLRKADYQAGQGSHDGNAPSEAEHAVGLKEEFLALIAHEMRTPLASIVGFASMMTSQTMTWPRESLIEYASIIEDEAQRMSGLIEQLTDHARQRTGTLRVELESTSLEMIVRSAMPQLRALTTQHHLLIDIPPHLPRIQADPQRLAQVLTNLVGNAARYSQPQTRITVYAKVQGSNVQVDVIDEGRGIPPEHREKVFEPFHQTDRSATKGLGLGLALCKDLVERHKGRIWVQDYEGPGTIMSFTLPLSQDELTPFEQGV